MKCKTHKRYESKFRPRCSCVDCWIMYIESNPDIDIINNSIKYMQNFHGYFDIEDITVSNYLFDKRKELERKND